jgi:hypothetical protein
MAHAPIMNETKSLWATEDRSRWFLLDSQIAPVQSDMAVRYLPSDFDSIDLHSLAAYEVSEEVAYKWAIEELGQTLEEIRCEAEAQLENLRRRLGVKARTPVQRSLLYFSAPSALLNLVAKLPSVIFESLSGDHQSVEKSKATFSDLQQQLRDSGIPVDSHFSDFPSRLAQLRADFDARRRK